jgi:exodeoxyribonuclease VII large subunit
VTLWDPGDPGIEGPRAGAAGDPVQTWSVAELGRALRLALADRFPTEVWVRGEIRNLRPPNANGHRYFELVEAGAEPGARPTASLSVALFDRARRQVNETLRSAGGAMRMADGIEIRIRGSIDWWVASGRLQFVMSDIDPVFTIGQLDIERARLLARLHDEGLARLNAALPLTALPLRLGLVTSRGSAAHADTLHELERSGYRFTVITVDVRVQGPDAPRLITAAVGRLSREGVDAVLVVRGGGARTDLVAFDDERVARAIATCPVPVFCGIGHEVDRSVADEVCHTSAKTPTACATAIVEQVRRSEHALERGWAQVAGRVERSLAHAEARVDSAAARSARSARLGLRSSRAYHERAAARLERSTTGALRQQARHVDDLQRRLGTAPLRALRRGAERLDQMDQQRRLADPALLLARGWSVTHAAAGLLVRTPSDAPPGTRLHTLVAAGTLHSEVLPTSGDGRDPSPAAPPEHPTVPRP